MKMRSAAFRALKSGKDDYSTKGGGKKAVKTLLGQRRHAEQAPMCRVLDSRVMDDENADQSHYVRLWVSLTEPERNYVATQFCFVNGIEDWRVVLARQEKRERLAKGRALLRNIGIVVVLALVAWISMDYSNARDSRRKLEYIYGRRSDNPVLSAGLTWVDREFNGYTGLDDDQ